MDRLKRYLTVAAILLSGLTLRVALMGTRTVAFNSDEAVVALMAKHILAGERPVFFYGQSYMGSLDAFLIAVAFRLFGTSVFSVRLVQLALFGGLILATYHLVRRLYGDETTAQITALLVALPPPLMVLYTTLTLGGYGETLLFGTILLILGHKVTHERQDSWLPWVLLGLIAGLAFWTLPVSVVYMVPVALAILGRWKWRRVGRYGVAFAAFLLGSSPWWLYCLSHGNACIKPLVQPTATVLNSTSWLENVGQRAFGFLFLGVPALWGLRLPSSAAYILSIPAILVLLLYLGSILYALRVRNRARFLPLAMGGTLLAVFLFTPFGNDATGRYLLPLYLPVALLAAELIRAIKNQSRWLATAALACMLAFNVGISIGAAMTTPTGLTSQLSPWPWTGNQDDRDLIAFLEENDEQVGYSQFWVAYKITFMSDERIIIAARLSLRSDVSERVQDRYPAYSTHVDESPDSPAYITFSQPELDELVREAFDAHQIDYKEKVIGVYRVFYNLSDKVTPEELGLNASE